MKAIWRANWLRNTTRGGVLVAVALAYPALGFAGGRVIGPTATVTAPVQTSPSTTTPYAEAHSLGYSVASSADGTVVVIGVPGANITPLNGTTVDAAGAAFVYVEPTGGWSGTLPQPKILTSATLVSGSGFGDSVAISNDGDTIVVGAPNANNGEGAAYVFTNPGPPNYWGNGGTYPSNAELTADTATSTGTAGTTGTSGDMFGISVAVSNGLNPTVVVGAEDHASKAGAAYVFYYDNNLGWLQDTSSPLTAASDAAANALFGESVAITSDGSTILVGAPGYGSNSSGAGAAYVFTGGTSSWSTPTGIYDPANASNDAFGTSVAISGTSSAATAVIGAPGTTSSAGAAYVFTGATTSWAQAVEFSDPAGTAGDLFGTSVAISGDATVIAVGAPDAPPSSVGTPALYQFDEPSKGKNAGSWSSSAKSYTYEYSKSGQSSSNFGNSAAVGIDLTTGTVWVFGGAPGITSSTTTNLITTTIYGEAFVFTQ